MSKIAEILERITKLGLEMRGCTDSEIEEIQAAAGFPLPAAYVEFLRIAGRSMDEIGSDYSMFYPNVIKSNIVIQQDYSKQLNNIERRFVFFHWRGDAISFFCENSGDDPPIMGINSDGTIVLKNSSFTAFLDELIYGYETWREAARRRPNRN